MAVTSKKSKVNSAERRVFIIIIITIIIVTLRI